MSHPKLSGLSRFFPTRSSKALCSVLLIALLTFSVFFVLYTPKVGVSASGYTSLGLQVSPSGSSFKLGVNQSQTFSAQALNGTSPFVYVWSLTSSGNFTLSVKGELKQVSNASSLQVVGSELTLSYPVATEEYVSVSVSVKDSNGYSGQTLIPFVVADPYTSPGYKFDASTATASYIITADGLGWYRAVKGLDGSVFLSSTNYASIVQSAINVADGEKIVISNGAYTQTATIMVNRTGTQIFGQNSLTTVITASSTLSGPMFKVTPPTAGSGNEGWDESVQSLTLEGNKAQRTSLGQGIDKNDLIFVYANSSISGYSLHNSQFNDLHLNNSPDCGLNIYAPNQGIGNTILTNLVFNNNNGFGLFVTGAETMNIGNLWVILTGSGTNNPSGYPNGNQEIVFNNAFGISAYGLTLENDNSSLTQYDLVLTGVTKSSFAGIYSAGGWCTIQSYSSYDVLISDSQIVAQRGITISNVALSHLKVTGVSFQTSVYAISDLCSPANGQNEFTSNDFTNATTAGIINSNGANPIVANNLGVGSESLTNGLVLYLPLDENNTGTTPSTTADWSGYINNGAITGVSWISGLYGNGLNFTYHTNTVNLGNNPSLFPTTSLSVFLWVNISSTNSITYPRLISCAKSDGTYKGYEIQQNQNLYTTTVNINIGGAWTAYPLGTVTSTVWTLIGFTYDGSHLVTYVNGAQTHSTAVTGAITYTSPANNLYLGANSFGSSNYGLVGAEDDVRVYSVALSPNTVNILYTNGPLPHSNIP